MTQFFITLLIAFFPEPATYFSGRLELLKRHDQRPKAIHLKSGTDIQRMDSSSPGVLGAWLQLLMRGQSVPRVAEACGVEFNGAVTPRLVDSRVHLDLASSGWVLDQDTGLPLQLICKDERLILSQYGQGTLPLLFPERLILERADQRQSFQVVKIEF